jgi:hypothetical protein
VRRPAVRRRQRRTTMASTLMRSAVARTRELREESGLSEVETAEVETAARVKRGVPPAATGISGEQGGGVLQDVGGDASEQRHAGDFGDASHEEVVDAMEGSEMRVAQLA